MKEGWTEGWKEGKRMGLENGWRMIGRGLKGWIRAGKRVGGLDEGWNRIEIGL